MSTRLFDRPALAHIKLICFFLLRLLSFLFVFLICLFPPFPFLFVSLRFFFFDSLLSARSLGECMSCGTRVSSGSSNRMPRPCLLVTRSGGALEDLSPLAR